MSGGETFAMRNFIEEHLQSALSDGPSLPWTVLAKCKPKRFVLTSKACALKNDDPSRKHAHGELLWNTDPSKCVVKEVLPPQTDSGNCLLRLVWETNEGKQQEGWYESWQVWGQHCVEMERGWRYTVLAKAAHELGFVPGAEVYHVGDPVR